MAGLFNSLKKEFNSAASSISREVDSASRAISNKWDEHYQSPLLDNFKNGNVVQLISKSTGRSLQIVQAPTAQLVVDGLGLEGPEARNAHWTVVTGGRNIVQLHNNNNYLALKDGTLYIVHYPVPAQAGYETHFRLHQMSPTHVSLDSATPAENGRHVGILANGQVKSPVACGREGDSHFGVRLIYKAHPTAPATVVMNTNQKVVVGQAPGTTVVHVPQNQNAQAQPTNVVHVTGGNVTVIPAKK